MITFSVSVSHQVLRIIWSNTGVKSLNLHASDLSLISIKLHLLVYDLVSTLFMTRCGLKIPPPSFCIFKNNYYVLESLFNASCREGNKRPFTGCSLHPRDFNCLLSPCFTLSSWRVETVSYSVLPPQHLQQFLALLKYWLIKWIKLWQWAPSDILRLLTGSLCCLCP